MSRVRDQYQPLKLSQPQDVHFHALIVYAANVHNHIWKDKLFL